MNLNEMDNKHYLTDIFQTGHCPIGELIRMIQIDIL